MKKKFGKLLLLAVFILTLVMTSVGKFNELGSLLSIMNFFTFNLMLLACGTFVYVIIINRR